MKRLLCAALGCVLLVSGSLANFHVMQIDEVISGVNGNTSAQVIELRMKSAGQNVVSNSKLWAWDAAGTNRVLLLDLTTDVSSSTVGSRVLLVTSAFTSAMIAGGAASFSPDFTLAAAIPASYLAAGRITFENNAGSVTTPGTIYWSIAWGGTAYTGSTTSTDFTNDADGNFGKLTGPLYSGSSGSFVQGVIFPGAATAASTTNSADYTTLSGSATVTKNNGTSFNVVPEPGSAALIGAGTMFLGGFAFARRRR